MQYRKLDLNNDYTFGRRGEFHTGPAAIAQAVRTRLLLLLGEWWEDIEEGLPLYQKITGQMFGEADKRIADKAIKDRILGTRGVRELTAYRSWMDTGVRSLFAEVSLKTSEGDLIAMTIGGDSMPKVTIREVARWPT